METNRQLHRLRVKPQVVNHFAFSIKYIGLTAIVYAALVVAPVLGLYGEWVYFAIALIVALVCFRVIYTIVTEYFAKTTRSRPFAELMVVLTLFPPIIGPIIVLIYSLDIS